MSDKNPKHPLKKKKVAQKVNTAGSENEEAVTGSKHKKHIYEQVYMKMQNLPYDYKIIIVPERAGVRKVLASVLFACPGKAELSFRH